MQQSNFNKIDPNNYIHYYAQNIDHATDIINRLNMTKSHIMDIAIDNFKKRQQMKTSQGQNLQEISDFLDGSLFANALKGGSLNSLPVPNIENPQDAMMILSKSDSALDNIDKFLIDLQNNVGDYAAKHNQDYNKLINDITALVVEEYAANSLENSTTLGQEILRSILSRNNEQFFRLTGKSLEVQTDIVKIVAVILALQDPPQLEGVSMEVNYSSKVSSSITATGQKEIFLELRKKYWGWIEYMNAVAQENAFAVGVLKGNREVLEKLESVHGTIARVGDQVSKTNVQFDPRIKELLEESSKAYKAAMGKKKSKADVQMTITENGVTAVANVTMKHTKQHWNSTSSQHINLRLTHASPLSTMLVREAGISGNELYDIYNLAAGHGYYGEDGSLDLQWEQLINYLTYKAVLNSLAGINTEADANDYFAINNRIWTIGDVLQHIKESNSTVRWVEENNAEKGKMGGLTRKPYLAANAWISPYEKSAFSGAVRSAQVKPKITSIMHATKINVMLRLEDMKELMRKAL